MRFSSSIPFALPSPYPRLRLRLLSMTVAMLLLLISTASSTFAGSATWKTSPGSGDWGTASNWTPATVPNGASDTATFASSNVRNVAISADTVVSDIAFNAGASAFTIIANPSFILTISGVGITNNSGILQNFMTNGDAGGNQAEIHFTNSATAGSLTLFTNQGSSVSGLGLVGTVFYDTASAGNAAFINEGGADSSAGGSNVLFFGTSTAGNATFTNHGGALPHAGGGEVVFFETSTAGNATFTNHGGAVPGADGGRVVFFDFSTGGNSTFTMNGGEVSGAYGSFLQLSDGSTGGNATFTIEGGAVSGAFGADVGFDNATGGDATFIVNGGAVGGAAGGNIGFAGAASAGNATLIANAGVGGGEGGSIWFFDKCRGGTARVELFGNGNLDISDYIARRGVTIGSIEGDGDVFLGAMNLSVGSNSLSTVFSGVIQDGGIAGGTGGSLTKIGIGKLVLSHRNTYTGGTTVKRGRLLVNNIGDSGTGTGPVQVERGKLGGKGIIAGAVTVGTGNSSGAVLAPGYLHGAASPGAITIQSPLTFNGDGIYEMQVNSGSGIADEVIANGVTINSGAQFSFVDLGSGILVRGTVFTALNNTAATPIAGTFSNLPDGSIFSSNGNTYQVNYEGGDGNDLTLRVVP
jgi:autotransporter-associated beta strand protein